MSTRNRFVSVKRFGMILATALSLSSLSLAAVPNKKATIVFADFSERIGILFVATVQVVKMIFGRIL